VKQIYLLRHAESDWKSSNQKDFDRPLARKGIEEANKISCYCKSHSILVDKIFCSTAERTKQTFDICSDGLNYPIAEAVYTDELYFAGPGEIVKLIQSLSESISSVLIIGHNPSMQMYIDAISENSHIKYSTCGLAEILVESSWKDLSLKKCKLKSFIQPGEL
jgi:phosphohistidine phosphatase